VAPDCRELIQQLRDGVQRAREVADSAARALEYAKRAQSTAHDRLVIIKAASEFLVDAHRPPPR
jgi:hypothetical protein